MSLLSLPDELLTCLLTKCTLVVDLFHAARACSRLRAAAEAASEQILNSESGPLFVPLGWRDSSSGIEYILGGSCLALTLRMRLALSFREAYKQARTLVHLKAGLIVYGSACCVGDERGGALAETLQGCLPFPGSVGYGATVVHFW